jgi:hypothetical protein
MIGLQDWICDLLVSRGALVEPDQGGHVGAMLPSEVASTLGVEQWFSLDAGDDDAEWMDRMERLLPAPPLVVEAQYRSQRHIPPIEVSAVLASELAIQNGISRLVEDSIAAATYLFFTFQYTIESDDRSTGIATVCLNADAGSLVSMPENLLLGIRDGLLETGGVAGPTVISRWYPSAARAAQTAIRKHVAQAEETANRRLARDAERVESYYAELLAQMERRIVKRTNDPAAAERERSRAEATRIDRAAKLEDLRRKYALRIRIDLALLLSVRMPVRRISLRLIRKKEERAHALDWNPVIGVLELPICEYCSMSAQPLYLCERIHLLCKNCWTQCASCSRFFCRICQPQCKCDTAKSAPPQP